MIQHRTECSGHTEESHFIHLFVYLVFLSFRKQKKQSAFLGFGEEVGLEFLGLFLERFILVEIKSNQSNLL